MSLTATIYTTNSNTKAIICTFGTLWNNFRGKNFSFCYCWRNSCNYNTFSCRFKE